MQRAVITRIMGITDQLTNLWYPQCYQECDQIVRFIGLSATFSSLWQQLFCPNLSHS